MSASMRSIRIQKYLFNSFINFNSRGNYWSETGVSLLIICSNSAYRYSGALNCVNCKACLSDYFIHKLLVIAIFSAVKIQHKQSMNR